MPRDTKNAETTSPKSAPPRYVPGGYSNEKLSEFPDAARTLDRRRNPGLRPEDVPAGAKRLLWWKCPEGPDHRWLCSVYRRTRGVGCPFCDGKKASVTNSLASLMPRAARWFDLTKNAPVRPDDVVAGSGKRFWWRCPKGPDHCWQASPGAIKKAKDCPFCMNRRASVTNSLATVAPLLASQWHPTRNGSLSPDQVAARSTRKVWWKCPKGRDHVWQISSWLRTTQNRGCPFCAGRRVSMTNRLVRTDPALVKLWHPTKNGSLRPSQVTAGSSRRVWWKCPNGPDHEWQVRLSGLKGCPFCAGRRASVTNSLAAWRPSLAAQWHPTKNGDLTPAHVTTGSGRRVFWRCTRNASHVWAATVAHRAHYGTDCPVCSVRKPRRLRSRPVSPRSGSSGIPSARGAEAEPGRFRIHDRGVGRPSMDR